MNVGIKMAVVSNFDLRLRPLLDVLGLDKLFDALIISAEVGASYLFNYPLGDNLKPHIELFMERLTLPSGQIWLI